MITRNKWCCICMLLIVLSLISEYCCPPAQAADTSIPRPAKVAESADVTSVSADFDGDGKQEVMAFSVTGKDLDENEKGVLWFVKGGKITQKWDETSLAKMYVANFTPDGKAEFIYTTNCTGTGRFWNVFILQYVHGRMVQVWAGDGTTRSGRDYVISLLKQKSVLINIRPLSDGLGYTRRKSRFEAVTLVWAKGRFKAVSTRRTTDEYETTDEAKQALGIRGILLHPKS